MNIIIANDQEFNPQIGGVERVSSELAKSFVALKHNVYFIAFIRSQYSQSYSTAVEQFFLPDQTNTISNQWLNLFENVIAK
jgi:hypothetical protein